MPITLLHLNQTSMRSEFRHFSHSCRHRQQQKISRTGFELQMIYCEKAPVEGALSAPSEEGLRAQWPEPNRSDHPRAGASYLRRSLFVECCELPGKWLLGQIFFNISMCKEFHRSLQDFLKLFQFK